MRKNMEHTYMLNCPTFFIINTNKFWTFTDNKKFNFHFDTKIPKMLFIHVCRKDAYLNQYTTSHLEVTRYKN